MEPLFKYIDKIEQEIEVLKLGLEYTQWKGYRFALGNMNPKDFALNLKRKIWYQYLWNVKKKIKSGKPSFL